MYNIQQKDILVLGQKTKSYLIKIEIVYLVVWT